MKLNCLTASVITALLMAISVFVANVGHTEYKSQIRKRKLRKIERVICDNTETFTESI
jgi:hypothetical protein